MFKNKVCIVIPIYKEILNDFEIHSVVQCLKVLFDYKIYFVCPERLNTDFYNAKFPEINNYRFFDENYFKDLSGYNRLMLNADFYKTFDDFEYMLVYQTDCYVFKDELLVWAQKGYDYLGGIWFENYNGNPYAGAKLWQAGNGGLSLRNIKKCHRLVTSKRPIKDWSILLQETKILKNVSRLQYLYSVLELPFSWLGFKNNLHFKAQQFRGNEDTFFIDEGLKLNWFKIPDVQEVTFFSWDKFPNYLWDTFKQLPFGCHAWYREDTPYENNWSFWKNRIHTDIHL